jgi:heme-degrading monooxygenase HmoA/hemerythrin-like domain-containing protein
LEAETMILEVADIRIAPGRQAEFEQAAHHGIQTVIARSTGFRGYQVRHSIESPDRYLLLLEWDTLEDHTVGFRGSAAYAQWRGLVVEFFAQPPFVEHFAATRPAPAQPVGMASPIQDFSDCHAGILAMLDELTALSRQRGPVPHRHEAAGRILRCFRDVVSAHHREEEAELFAAVLADAAAGDEHTKVEALVNQLRDDHRHLEELYARLAPALSALESRSDIALDAADVARLVDEYQAHARLEEDVLLPLAQGILGRNSDHLAALGLALHIRHAAIEVRQKYGFI